MNKLKALIVDDEFVAREMIKNLVDWKDLGYELPVTATNGAEALQIFGTGNFDIVFTDIEMPIMDGIDFITSVRKINPTQRIVIISCHEKFEYAQRALRMGVENYMIKDLVTENELKAVLCSVAPQKKKFHNIEKIENSLNEFLKETVNGNQAVIEKLPCKYLAVYIIAFDEQDQLIFDRGIEEFSNTLEAFAARLSCLAFYIKENKFVYILSETPETNSVLFYMNNTISNANAIKATAKMLKLGTITIGVSDPVGSASDIVSACNEAMDAVNMRVLEGFGKTIIYSSISIKKNLLDYERMDYLLQRIEELCKNSNPTCVKFLDKLYAAEMSNGFADVNYFKYINVRMWAILITLAQAKGISQTDILNEMGLNIDEINHIESSEMMAQFFKSLLMKLVSTDEAVGSESIVSLALSLIENEYTNDISLSYIADKLHTHKSYLCRLFKEQMGENLMPYIENKRIERAKYLLYNSQMKFGEIADSLGFTSPQYFSFVFKKSTGLSPTEFKKENIDK